MVRNIAVVVTDGKSNIDSQLTIPTANTLRDAGIEVFVVGMSYIQINIYFFYQSRYTEIYIL